MTLERCVNVPIVLVDARGTRAISADQIPAEIEGAAVLFRTDWDHHWGTSFYGDASHPHLTSGAAQRLARGGAALVGMDCVNVDDTSGDTRPIHTTLLGSGVLIVENLTNLAALPATDCTFHAAPLPVKGMPSIPVRAFAVGA